MPEAVYSGWELTRHVALPRRYFGRTARDWFRFYGLVAVLWFFVVMVYVRYFEMFDDIDNKSAEYQSFVAWFAGSALAVVLPAVIGFIWWAAGALVRYSKWQTVQPMLWRWFWVVMLAFYTYIEFDALDNIHPQMSHKGLGNAPDLIAMFETGYRLSDGIPLAKFQWGYFLLWALLWFLIAVLHWQYVIDGLREVWFYTQRFHRYGASVLTGFRETMRTHGRPPVTVDYSREKMHSPGAHRGVPQLNVARLTPEQAQAIIDADMSGAITPAPGQPTVLFIDLGCYDFSPALAELTDNDGTPLLRFSERWPEPGLSRSELVVPLKAPARDDEDAVGAGLSPAQGGPETRPYEEGEA
jgi:hypothetical protein